MKEEKQASRSRGFTCIAVGSGKGGVGKSTCSANIAVFAAKHGLRVGIVDLDPLADIAVIFDLEASVLDRISDDPIDDGRPLSAWTARLVTGVDVLFPKSKLRRGASSTLRDLIFRRFIAEIRSRYDLLILDMPAGIGQEENLDFLPYIDMLIVVALSEPTSHVSAGGYIKAALEIRKDLDIRIWHNKFESLVRENFDPRKLVDNYQTLVPEDLRLTQDERKRVRDLAFIPHDPSMDLLKANSEFHFGLLARMVEVFQLLDEQAVAELPEASGLARPLRLLLRYHTLHNFDASRVEDFENYLRVVLQRDDVKLSPEQRVWVQKYLLVQRRHPLRLRVRKAQSELTAFLELAVGSNSFMQSSDDSKALGRKRSLHALMGLLDFLSYYLKSTMRARAPWAKSNEAMIERLAGLLLFYYSLFVLSEHESIKKLVLHFTPHRRSPDGSVQRNRHALIQNLVEQDEAHRLQFFNLVKRFFPLQEKQLYRMAKAKNMAILLYRNKDGSFARNAYLKLLSQTLHDLVHGGLGISVGMKFNLSSQAMRDACRQLFSELGIVDPRSK